jgi:hypothetical protein
MYLLFEGGILLAAILKKSSASVSESDPEAGAER